MFFSIVSLFEILQYGDAVVIAACIASYQNWWIIFSVHYFCVIHKFPSLSRRTKDSFSADKYAKEQAHFLYELFTLLAYFK